ncbi:hypothetical protein BHM03_00048931 [Ensete ventricosum]|nr:hypothetical protein BHM03_00048931 [Ensete ventricosum]
MSRTFGLGRFDVSGADTSGGLPRELLGSVSTEEDLHKGLIGMGVPDVTPPMFKSKTPLVQPGGFYTHQQRVDHTLSLTSTLTSGVTVAYGESAGVEVWREGVAHHAAFMTCGSDLADVSSGRCHLGCRHGYGASVGPSPARTLTWPLSWHGFHYLIFLTHGWFYRDGEHEPDAQQSQGWRGTLGNRLLNFSRSLDASTTHRISFAIRGARDPCRRGNKEGIRRRDERSARGSQQASSHGLDWPEEEEQGFQSAQASSRG